MIVYLIRNKVNGRGYVGQTVQKLQRRWGQHVSAAKHGHSKSILSNGINKYGADQFEVTVLAECRSQWHLNVFEALYIQTLGTLAPAGYNLQEGGSRSKMSDEARARIKAGAIGRKRNEEHIQRTTERLVAFTRSPEGRLNASTRALGKKRTPLQKAMMQYRRYKPIRLRDPDGQIQLGLGVELFCEARGLVVAGIIDLIKGRRSEYKGWTVP